MEKILVTGGEGYIGSNIVKKLLDKKYYVISFDNLLNSFEKNKKYKNYKFIKGDVRNFESLNNVFKEHKIKAIFHCASLIYVGESVKKPLDYFDVNVIGTINIIKAMKENNVNKIIYSSTAATYGIKKNNEKFLEDDIQLPINPYGDSKLISEKLIIASEKAYQIKSIIFRYFNVAGSNNSDKLFYNPKIKKAHIIPIIKDFFLEKTKDFKINGNDYNTKDGTCIRDYVHILDLVDAHILGLEYLIKNEKSNIFNISSGKGYSNLEIFNIGNKIFKKNFEPQFNKRREGDPDYLVASNEKIKKILNWKPKHKIEDIFN